VAVLVTGLVLPLVAGAVLVLSLSDGISHEARPVERTGRADPGQGAQSRTGRCERIMTRYLRELSGTFGKANATAALFIEASNEFGPGSARYRALIDIYGDVQVNTLMAKGKSKKALEKARPHIRAACAR
jgi:hypothetical protein